VRLAQKKGVSFAARRFDVNRKTVYYWLRISRKDWKIADNGSKIISVSQKEQIIRFAKKGGISTITEFKKSAHQRKILHLSNANLCISKIILSRPISLLNQP